MLGSHSDAEDAVQETWLRWERHGPESIDNLGGWLTRVVGRICLDLLRRRTTRGESSLDAWVSEAVVDEDDPTPEQSATLSDSLGPAMLIVLDSLRPEERVAFVLHDMFTVPFAEIAAVIGSSEAAAKMAASRARRKVKDTPRPSGELSQRRAVVDAFLTAARNGDFDSLLHILNPGLSWHRSNAHGHMVQMGANEVLAAIRRGDPDKIEIRKVNVNGEPGLLVLTTSGHRLGLMACTVADGRMVGIVSITSRKLLERLNPSGQPPSS